jgi:transcriptional regulator with XRE-family HTH domain
MSSSTSTAKRRNQVPSGRGVEDAFGEVLRHIRKKRNLSQEMLARQTGFDRTFVGMLERGLASPSLRTLFRLAEGLRVTPSQIIRRMERLKSGRSVGRM